MRSRGPSVSSRMKTLVLQAKKDWGPAGPAICEAHWGLYAEGKTDFAHLLNDDIVLRSSGHPKDSR